MGIYSKTQLTTFLKGEKLEPYQQSGSDLVLFYGEDLSKEPAKIILLNAKSHKISRNSRAPNIMSAQRLLENCYTLVRKNMIDDVEYWFVGINYQSKENIGTVENIYVKDLFKINVHNIAQINFDAAIQIQNHVEDMEEIDQTRVEFIRDLNDLFINKWQRHTRNKTEKYEELYTKICNVLRDY